MLSPLARALLKSSTPFLALTGCSGESMSVEEARRAIVVEAADARVTGAVLEQWLAASARMPGNSAAGVLVSGWIDQALLATAIQGGVSLVDSATTDAVILPDAIRGSIVEYLQRPPPSDVQVDSLIALDRVRVYQQLQLLVPEGAASAEIDRIAVRAGDLGRDASRAGADFSALVRRFSEDSVGKANDGFLPPVTRGELPNPIAGLVWNLKPGEVSAALRSSGGLHIFRRVSVVESRERLRAWLRPRLMAIDEPRFIDSVVVARGPELASGASARARAMAREPVPADSGPPLASWSGGTLPAATVRAWVMMLTPIERVALHDASDASAATFLHDLVRREILFALAVPEGGVTARARGALAPAYREALDSVQSVLREVSGPGTPDPGQSATAVIDSVVGMVRKFRPLPGALAGVLRQRYPVTVNAGAIGVLVRAARLSWVERQGADTAGAPPGL